VPLRGPESGVIAERTNFGSVEMLKNLNVHGGFAPATLALPQCDNPREGNNSTITLRRGGQGGQALSSPSKHVSFLFCTILRGILQSPNFHCLGVNSSPQEQDFQKKEFFRPIGDRPLSRIIFPDNLFLVFITEIRNCLFESLVKGIACPESQ
jgi:hypothetical protein